MAYYSRVRHFNRFIVFSLAPSLPAQDFKGGDEKCHKMPDSAGVTAKGKGFNSGYLI